MELKEYINQIIGPESIAASLCNPIADIAAENGADELDLFAVGVTLTTGYCDWLRSTATAEPTLQHMILLPQLDAIRGALAICMRSIATIEKLKDENTTEQESVFRHPEAKIEIARG